MKICVIGAPSTGKSVFARTLSAEMTKQGLSCELVQEYASTYIQQVGAPIHAWEQLVISLGQYLSERETARHHMVTDAAAFATYIYAQKLLPKTVATNDWPKYRQLLDMLRTMARLSVASYDVIFLLTHVFPPQSDGVRLKDHLSYEECVAINKSIEEYLLSERAHFHAIEAIDQTALQKALAIVTEKIPQAAL